MTAFSVLKQALRLYMTILGEFKALDTGCVFDNIGDLVGPGVFAQDVAINAAHFRRSLFQRRFRINQDGVFSHQVFKALVRTRKVSYTGPDCAGMAANKGIFKESVMDMIYWDHYYNVILLLNLLIVIGLFASLRFFSGVIAHVNASDELLRKDNPAFGISLAAATFAVTIMLSGTIYGSPENDLVDSVVAVGLFGVLGIALMAVTRIVFEKITLADISLRDEIVKGNKAVAIADAGNVLAAAIIIRAVMIWVTVYSLDGVIALLGAYAVSQVILTTMTLIRMKVFGAIKNGSRIQDELKNGNVAVALHFAGQKIGTAFAIAMAAQIVVYEQYDLVPILTAWFVASVAIILIWKMLSYVAERIILFRVNLYQEVFEQGNVAIGALRAVIYISMALLLSQL